LVFETVKLAEDGDGLIVRLYESERRRGTAVLHCGFSLGAAWRTNLLEENQAELVVEDDAVQVAIRPFQIITLRLQANH
jgi:alpha-mannosidase